MVRRKFKWKFGFFLYIMLLSAFTKSLPLEKSIKSLPKIVTTDTSFTNLLLLNDEIKVIGELNEKNDETNQDNRNNITTANLTSVSNKIENSTVSDEVIHINTSVTSLLRNQLRPGQTVRSYSVDITIDGGQFHGRTLIDVRLDTETREDPIKLYLEDMNINSVQLGIFTEANAFAANFDVDEGILEIDPGVAANSFIVIIEYTANIRNDGTGIFSGNFNNQAYIGMNLYPTHARRVFPCIDELTEIVPVLFTFHNVGFNNIVANSMFEDNSLNEFRTLAMPLHLWGMVAHNFPTVMFPVNNVILYGRTGLNQEAQASIAIQHYFNELNEWTSKDYFEIMVNQDGRFNIFATPDTSVSWHALSTVCIWEPYIYMETVPSQAHKYKAFVKIGEAIAGQWFGYVVYPENWRHQWVITGLQMHAVYELLRDFQNDPFGTDTTLLDINTLFVTEVIQESLYHDAYASTEPLLPGEDVFDEARAREIINNHIKYKAPAFLWMLKNIFGDTDYIQEAARSLINRWSLEPITTLDLYDVINSAYGTEPNPMIDDFEFFMEQWVNNRGYPIITIQYSSTNMISVFREHFAYSQPISNSEHQLPLTYTTSLQMDFSNVRPVTMLQNNMMLQVSLPEEEDFVLFNIQGQGYYRVNYDLILWERILWCLEEPDCRNQIHPLNRATLVDDALNLARAGKLSYEIAFPIVLTMEHETEYAPWRAFIRNMNFLRKRLVALVSEDEDLDPDIYLRMVRRTIGTFENEITFTPDPLEPAMVSLTRGLVMDHACQAGYEPCIAASIDIFYDPNSNEPVVNPDIPKDIRPAVYCTMVREGDADVINALNERLAVEPSHYERVVILESLGCSRDDTYIWSLLTSTIMENSPYGVAERSKIFTAVAEASFENARLALQFLRQFTNEIRNMYGGPTVLEEMIYVMVENIADGGLTDDFNNWTTNIFNNLEDSEGAAFRARDIAIENMIWNNQLMDEVYEWIDENDATKAMLSLILLSLAMIVNLFNSY